MKILICCKPAVIDKFNLLADTVYQNGNGEPVTNLGVHEHWNNAEERLYSRNLGKEEGIELISIEP